MSQFDVILVNCGDTERGFLARDEWTGDFDYTATAYANLRKFSRHQPAEPLFTEEDARKVMKQFRALPTGEDHALVKGVSLRLVPSGHIIGASSVAPDAVAAAGIHLGDVRDGSPLPTEVEAVPESDGRVFRLRQQGGNLPEHVDVVLQKGLVPRGGEAAYQPPTSNLTPAAWRRRLAPGGRDAVASQIAPTPSASGDSPSA